MKVMCVNCSGMGTNICPDCGGRGSTQRLTMTGDMDINSCLVCGGSGQVPCQICGGQGEVGQTFPGPDTPPLQSKSGDPLEGRWNGQQGNAYDFVRDGESYRVTEHSPLGKVGSGTATLAGSVVKLNVTNDFLGKYDIELQLTGDTLRGEFAVMGMTVPMVLQRR